MRQAAEAGEVRASSPDPLTPRFVDESAPRVDRRVQRLDRRLHRDRDALVGRIAATAAVSPAPSPPIRMASGPRQDRSRTAAGRRAAPWRRPGSHARARRRSSRVGTSRSASDRQPERAAHRSAQRLPAERIGRRPGAMTPVAPPASATRTMAPMLPGSCTSHRDDDERAVPA